MHSTVVNMHICMHEFIGNHAFMGISCHELSISLRLRN